MIFLKVGKVKHKFKLKLIIAKYKYLPQQQIPKNALFKVKVTRGSHQIEAFSTPTKKGSIKFPKTEHIIPMTLFYDESSNEYLEKTTEIKTYICDENGNVIRTIGKTELNIAEYASKQKFGLEIEIEGESKKIQQDVVITLQMILQRQDDDSKSVNTVSEDDVDLRSVQLKRQDKSQNKDRSKSKDKKSYLFPSITAQSQVTVKSAEDGKLKHSGVTEVDEKLSQKAKKNKDKNEKSPIKQLQENISSKNQEYKRDLESSQDDHFFSRLVNKLSQVSERRQASINKQVQRKDKQKEKALAQQQKFNEQNSYKEDEQTKNGSIEFRLHMATKKINSLEKENNQLKSQSYRLKQIVQQLIEQKSQKDIAENSTNSKMQQQIEQYKKTLIEKQMKINQLQGLNKLVVGREEQKQKENKGLRKEVNQLKTKLQYEKNKLAKVLQKAMESQNMELLQIIEKQLNDDDFY